MEKSELYSLIESYLDNTLPDAKRKEVEHRMVNDEEFRHEVQLHADLQKNFSDPVRWRLRTTMMDVLKEHELTDEATVESTPRSAYPFLKLSILLGTIFLFIGFWFWLKPSTDEIPKSDPIEALPPTEPSTPNTGSELDSTKIKPSAKEDNSPKQKPGESSQFAMADPADLQPNSSMEALVNSTSRSQDEGSLVMTSPVMNSAFTPNAKGETLIRFAGKLDGDSNDPQVELVLNIFNNKNIVSSLVSAPMDVIQNAAGSTFDVRQRLQLPLGLYYFTVEYNEEVLYAGKFFIGQLK